MGPPKPPSSNFFTPRNSNTPRATPTSTSTASDQIHSHVVLGKFIYFVSDIIKILLYDMCKIFIIYYHVAVTEGRGHARGEVGIAVIDIKRPKLILCQLSDRQTYANALTKISVFQPVEVNLYV